MQVYVDDRLVGHLNRKFKWRAIQVDQDTYEEHLFDHHEFEPYRLD